MPWVYGWPLSPERAVKVAKEHNLVKGNDPDECECLHAASLYIADKAHWDDVLGCWMEDGDFGFIFSAYVDWRHRSHPPKRFPTSKMEPLWKWYKLAKFIPIKTKPQWYRYDDGTWDPIEGELWDRTESTDDEDEDYPPESGDGKSDADHEVQDDSCKTMSEQGDEDIAMSGTECDPDAESADGESTPRVMVSTPPESGETLAPQFDAQCSI